MAGFNQLPSGLLFRPGFLLGLVAISLPGPAAADGPAFKYTGAGACSAVTCHGSLQPNRSGKTRSNEYTVWSQKDSHAKAFEVLHSEKSQKIARALKFGVAAKSEKCLTCHTTGDGSRTGMGGVAYKNEKLQGRNYDPEEGVSCNACHGPAERWLASHADKGWTTGIRREHSDRSELFRRFGFYDTKPVMQRANNCVSCHLRIEPQMVQAGHPPLYFELFSFSERMPPHWKDRGSFFRPSLWAAGQTASLEEALRQLANRAKADAKTDSVNQARVQALGHAAVLRHALPDSSRIPLEEIITSLRSVGNDPEKIASTAESSIKVVSALGPVIESLTFDESRILTLLRDILDDTIAVKLGLIGAEQTTFAADALYATYAANASKHSGETAKKFEAALDDLWELMEVEADEFDTAASVAALRKCAEAANAPPFPPDHRRLIRVVRPEPEPIIEVELGGMSAEEIAAKAKAVAEQAARIAARAQAVAREAAELAEKIKEMPPRQAKAKATAVLIEAKKAVPEAKKIAKAAEKFAASAKKLSQASKPTQKQSPKEVAPKEKKKESPFSKLETPKPAKRPSQTITIVVAEKIGITEKVDIQIKKKDEAAIAAPQKEKPLQTKPARPAAERVDEKPKPVEVKAAVVVVKEKMETKETVQPVKVEVKPAPVEAKPVKPVAKKVEETPKPEKPKAAVVVVKEKVETKATAQLVKVEVKPAPVEAKPVKPVAKKVEEKPKPEKPKASAIVLKERVETKAAEKPAVKKSSTGGLDSKNRAEQAKAASIKKSGSKPSPEKKSSRESTVTNIQSPETLPRFKYTGSGSCSAVSCHGASQPKKMGRNPGNEFTVWSQKDSHAKSFKALYSDDAEKIAKAMGLAQPHKSDKCLVCHSTGHGSRLGLGGIAYREKALQGNKFDIVDGVSCNACHGPAERWLEPHSKKGFTTELRKKNPDRMKLFKEFGLYDLKKVMMRANNCVSCHLRIDLEMVEAGHPLLRFELSSHSENMPPHWIDRDEFSAPKLWIAGQTAALRESLQQIADLTLSETNLDRLVNFYRKQSNGHISVLRSALPEEARKVVNSILTSLEEAGDQSARLVFAANEGVRKVRALEPVVEKLKFDTETTRRTLLALLDDNSPAKFYLDGIEKIAFGIDALFITYAYAADDVSQEAVEKFEEVLENLWIAIEDEDLPKAKKTLTECAAAGKNL